MCFTRRPGLCPDEIDDYQVSYEMNKIRLIANLQNTPIFWGYFGIIKKIMKKSSELFFRVVLIPIDYIMIVAGFATAFIVRHDQNKPLAYLVSGRSFLKVILPVLLVWIVIYAFAGLYKLNSTRSRLYELSRVAVASSAGVMLLIIMDFFRSSPLFPSKSIPVYGLVFAIIFVGLARVVIYTIQRLLFRYGVGVHNTLVVGRGPARINLARVIPEESPAYRVVKNLAIDSSLDISKLDRINKKYILDDIFIVEEEVPQGTISKLVNFCRQNQLQLHILPSLMELNDAPTRMGRLNNLPVLEIVPTPLDGWSRILKRFMDLILLIIIFIIALPLMLIIAVMIKLTDKGPIFYKHERLTRSGKKIKVIKFRTMKSKYCTGGEYGGKSTLEVLKTFNDPALVEEFERDMKVKNDPRLNVLGKFLRQTSLDELPQLFNILKNDISFVGPRPITEEELKRYGDESGLFLHIKPGLTGLWQVSGRNDIDYDSRVKLDIYYIENWNVGMDVAIILRTIPTLLLRRSGY